MAKEKAKEKKTEAAAPQRRRPRSARHSAQSASAAKKFEKEVKPALMKEFELKNPMAVPQLHKIVVNMGVGEATQNAKVLDPAVNETGRRSPARSRSSPRPRNRSPPSRCAKACPSA